VAGISRTAAPETAADSAAEAEEDTTDRAPEPAAAAALQAWDRAAEAGAEAAAADGGGNG